ncbi:c-type cytochrome [Euzebya rosea]|uniref:c-type cytochrome n=1 Tax=Euzebya rosea TaxID=2052804 RepID=UPI000D3E977E|nr:cytochrome c [Euzebya rosea]
MRAHLTATVLLVLLAGCAGTPSTDVSADGATADVAVGEELYQANCAQCHGVDLRGTDQGPPHLDAVYLPNHHADISFFLAVRDGVRPHHWNFGPMPSIDGLSDDDVTDIVAYVRAQQQAAGLLE